MSSVPSLPPRAADTLAKELEPLHPSISKTWKVQFKGSTPEKPRVDVAKWERALDGQAVRILHSINQRLEYHYFTTAGLMTHGTMKVEGNKLITRGTVIGGE
jgi:hypothetical protein